jgi:endonuclease-3
MILQLDNTKQAVYDIKSGGFFMRVDIHSIMRVLRGTAPRWREPVVTEIAKVNRDPFRILISTLISLRTKDEVTREAADRLFALADTPQAMADLPREAVEKAVFPAGFYRNKARTILEVSRTLVERFGGKVPCTLDELLAMKGIGRKTANLVITMGFGKAGICVDTHVHRITNRWGYVTTRSPRETEFVLREILPGEYWIEINDVLVAFGQNICKPVSPICSQCPVHQYCARVGVTVHR